MKISGIANGMNIMCETKPGGEYLAMGLIGAGDADIADTQAIRQPMRFDRRMIAVAPFEGIAETFPEQAKGLGACIAGHRRAAMMVKLTDVVQAMAVIGMIMRPQNRVDVHHVSRKQLGAHIR